MIMNHRNSIYMRMTAKNFKKDNDVEMYINIIIDLIEQREQPNQRIKLEGVLKYHNKSCTKTENCHCWKILQLDAQAGVQAKQEDD